jgi:hypothetical protein
VRPPVNQGHPLRKVLTSGMDGAEVEQPVALKVRKHGDTSTNSTESVRVLLGYTLSNQALIEIMIRSLWSIDTDKTRNV